MQIVTRQKGPDMFAAAFKWKSSFLRRHLETDHESLASDAIKFFIYLFFSKAWLHSLKQQQKLKNKAVITSRVLLDIEAQLIGRAEKWNTVFMARH